MRRHAIQKFSSTSGEPAPISSDTPRYPKPAYVIANGEETFLRIAAAHSLSYKKQNWSAEQEVRSISLGVPGAASPSKQCLERCGDISRCPSGILKTGCCWPRS